MRVTLVYNPKSGHNGHDLETLERELREHGYKPDSVSVKEKSWQKALREPGELVVVAGGDGTVDKVAAAMMGRPEPLAIVPKGTANNVARCLGIGGSTSEVIAGWSTARRRRFDVGRMSGLWEEPRTFLEAVGLGFFAQMIPVLSALGEQRQFADAHEKLLFQADILRTLLAKSQAETWEMVIDGEEIRGDFLLVEVMNVDRVGPSLHLSPGADPGDGELNILLVADEDRVILQEALDAAAEGRTPSLPLKTRHCQRVQILWTGSEVHTDGHVWTTQKNTLSKVQSPERSAPSLLELTVADHVWVLVPK
jgi:diacylglycerol kinase family enzyme